MEILDDVKGYKFDASVSASFFLQAWPEEAMRKVGEQSLEALKFRSSVRSAVVQAAIQIHNLARCVHGVRALFLDRDGPTNPEGGGNERTLKRNRQQRAPNLKGSTTLTLNLNRGSL